ncbi:peptide receptor gpcr [Plakobranchus ocellatus]|uniref:Peptide receptor gpcr n=1 Tax=Plakobranchus ocellatus TaxID=259542 RepID=A0AAV4DWF0_9GAST|nr:peptide receptor gpcr [Plakobranchus ocellatus]
MVTLTPLDVQETERPAIPVPDISSQSPPIAPILSNEAVGILFVAAVQVAQLVIATFGFFSNIVNVIVYTRMGFVETSSITLVALSLADLVTEIWLVLMAAGYRPDYDGTDVPPLSVTLVHAVSPISSAVLGYGSWITALISTERCLCIVYPMKVKSIFTVRRISILLVIVLIVQLSTIIPHYATMQLTYIQSPVTNRTELAFTWTEYSIYVESITLFASFTLPSLICFSIVVVCTTFLVIKLNQSARWRQSTSNVAGSKQDGTRPISSKETRVVHTVVLICAIYIFCFAPNVFTITAMAVYPNFHQRDPYLGNLVSVCFSVAYPCQSISSAINIFVYIRMSTKYRETFCQLFCQRNVRA